jgi:hypothetical protein
MLILILNGGYVLFKAVLISLVLCILYKSKAIFCSLSYSFLNSGLLYSNYKDNREEYANKAGKTTTDLLKFQFDNNDIGFLPL